MGNKTVAESKCSVCEERKPRSEFYSDRGRTTGVSSRCKPCARAVAKGRSAENYRREPREAQDDFRQWKYGVSPETYADMLFMQGGVCAICKLPERSLSRSGEIKALSVDHDHATGQVRGLLCSTCNSGLGYFADDLARLRAAVAYLEG